MSRNASQDNEERGFLSRWSRRKRGLENEHIQDEETRDLSPEPAPQDGLPGDSDREGNSGDAVPEDEEARANREAAEAIDLDSLTDRSDITAFLKRGVPNTLKNAALSKVWRSNPVFAVLDGLNDYDEDFRRVETLKDGFKTAWAVGKGYADKAESVAREMEAKSAELAAERAARNSMDDDYSPAEMASAEPQAMSSEAAAPDIEVQADPARVLSSQDMDEQSVERAQDDHEEEPRKVGLRRRMSFGLDEA